MEFRFMHLHRPYIFHSPFAGEFVLLLEISDPHITQAEQDALSKQFVDAGCRYALSRGINCSSWDDSIDFAYIQDESRPFVMTTWHEKEPIEEVVQFMLYCTTYEDFVPQHFLVLQLGGDGKALEQVQKLTQKTS